MARPYDVCIVGAGMVGSSAARHASITRDDGTSLRVCLVGPKEPKKRELSSSRDIFGCHYDEGRIVRCHDVDPSWTSLAVRSIKRFRSLEEMSGISFYTEVGFLAAGSKDNELLKHYQLAKDSETIGARTLSYQDMKVKFPYLNFGIGDIGFYLEKNSGYISARRFVLAQQTVAHLQGCDIIHEVAVKVTETTHEGGAVMQIDTDGGTAILASKVLLATNAYTNLITGLLPITPYLSLSPECVAFVEISAERALQLRDMPGMRYTGRGVPDWVKPSERIADGEDYQFYMLPPVKYPNGKHYLKLGSLYLYKGTMETVQDVKKWYCAPPPSDLVQDFATLITSVVKDVKPISITGDTCVLAFTESRRPYIDLVSSNLGVAIGGNGLAAKSADEIGRLGVELVISGKWIDDLPAEHFKLKLRTNHSKL